jgi:hypothetical protein
LEVGIKPFFSCIAAAVFLTGALSVSSDDERSLQELAPETRTLLQGAIGDSDPASPCRLAGRLELAQLMSAIYTGSRTERLLALDALRCLDNPWPMLPYTAALMGARERPVASRAALVLVNGLSDLIGKPDLEVVEGQVAQLAGQLLSLARDVRIDLDIRVSALAGVQSLQVFGNPFKIFPLELLEDSDAVIRRAGLALLAPPMEENTLVRLAKMVGQDDDLWLRGQAASLLCENALAHGVRAPSHDLAQVMKSVLGDDEVPAGAIGAVLGCLSHFPREVRVDLIDLAMGHPDPSIKEFWKSLNKR